MATVEELVTIFRVDSKDAVQQLNSLKEGVTKAVTALVSIAAAKQAWSAFRGIVDATAQLKTFSETTGVSTDKLQEWQYAAESMGVSASAVQSDLAKMQKQAMFTGRSLESYADMFKGMSAPVANQWGSALGISPDTVRLLREGSEGIAKLKAEAHTVGAVVSKEDIDAAQQFNRSIAAITTQVRAFGTSIALGVMPFVQKVLTWFKDFMTVNRDWIRLRMGDIANGFGNALERIANIFRRVKEVIGNNAIVKALFNTFGEGIDHTKLLTGVLGILAVMVGKLAVAFAVPVAAVVALSAVIEDFFAFIEGKDSVIGDLVSAFQENFPALGRLLSTLAEGAIPVAIDALHGLWNILKELAAFCSAGLEVITTGIESLAQALGRLVGAYSEEEEAGFRKAEAKQGQKAAAYQLSAEGWTMPDQKPQGPTDVNKLANAVQANQSNQPNQKSSVPTELTKLANDMKAMNGQQNGDKEAGTLQAVDQRPQNTTNTTNNVTNDNKVSVTINGLDANQTADKIKSLIPSATFNTPGLNTELVY